MKREKNFKNLEKSIKKKYYFKCIALIYLVITIIGILWSSIHFTLSPLNNKKANNLIYIYFAAIILAMFFVHIYDKLKIGENLSMQEYIEYFIKYFANEKYSTCEYRDSITWFSNKIHQEFIKSTNKEEEKSHEKIICALHLILKPDDHGLCIAFYHKRIFIDLCKELCNDDLKQINDLKQLLIEKKREMEKTEKEKLHITSLMYGDKNIWAYGFIILFHMMGCYLISIGASLNIFIGNLCLYVPSDVLLILVYKGIVAQKKE